VNTEHQMARMSDPTPRGFGVHKPPVVIRKIDGDWYATCNGECADPLDLWTDNHPHVYETAIGHALYRHPRAAL
jgi:hypothetical protein